MSLKETAYGLGLRNLGFTRVTDPTFFEFEVDGVKVRPIGRAYIRVSSPDHLTIVQDENGYIYRISNLIETQHLSGKDVTRFVAEGTYKETRRLKGRAYVPVPVLRTRAPRSVRPKQSLKTISL